VLNPTKTSTNPRVEDTTQTPRVAECAMPEVGDHVSYQVSLGDRHCII
jgi:hypothetical protein